MQMMDPLMKPPKNSTKVVWTYGAITGVCVGIIWWGVSPLVSHLVGPVLGILPVPLTMVGFLVVGILAAKQTDRVRTGTLAGLVAGLTSAIILVLLEGARPDLFSLAITFLVMLGFGAGIGTLGGLIGNRVQIAKVVWTYGAITGVGLGVLLSVTLQFAPPPILIIGLMASMVGFLVVGMLAAKQAGRVRTGTLAGLVAGLTSAIITCALIEVLGALIVVRGKVSLPTDGDSWVSVLLGLSIAFACVLGCSAGLGAGIGALGGLIGKRKASVPPAGDPMSLQQQLQQYPLQQQ